MKVFKRFTIFGMIGVISFFIHILLGDILHGAYNPINQSISELTADGAPYYHLLRAFIIIYEISLFIFLIGMIHEAFTKHNTLIKTGFTLLLLTVVISVIGFNTFPMTIRFILSAKNVMHTVTTVILLCLSILSVLLIALGYIRSVEAAGLGWVIFLCAMCSTLFNILMWRAASQGGEYFGLLERLTVYPFHAFTFMLSFRYACVATDKK